MTEFRFERRKENITDYIKTTMFGQNFAHKFIIAAMFTCLLGVAIAGVAMFIAMNRPQMLFLTGAAIILAAAYPLFLHFFIKNLVNKLTKENPDENGVTIAVSETEILLVRNNQTCGRIDWENITDIIEGKTGFFLTEKEGAAIILGKDSVCSGTYDEAVQIFRMKKAALK